MRIEAEAKAEYRHLLGNCAQCPLKGRPAVVIPSRCGAPITLLGEAPGPREEEQGDFFVGATGRFARHQFERFGESWQQLHRDNVLLCRPDKKLAKGEWSKAVAACRPRLLRTMAEAQSPVIVAFGAKAMAAVTGRSGLADWGGTLMDGTGEFAKQKVVATWHPAFALRKGKRGYLPVIAIHIRRACRLSQGTLIPYRWPKVIIEPGPRMVRALQKMLREKRRLAVDVETSRADAAATLLSVGLGTRDLVVSAPWDGYLWKGGEQEDLVLLPNGVEIAGLIRRILADPTIPKTGQNLQFDIRVLRAHGLELEGWEFDTLVAHNVTAPQLPHKLGFIAGIETNAYAWKADYHGSSDVKGAAVFQRQDPVKTRKYNGGDVGVTDALTDIAIKRLEQTHNGPAFFAENMELNRLGLEMSYTGIAVSDECRRGHQEALRSRLYTARGELKEIVRHVGMNYFNPRSHAQLHRLFFEKFGCRPTRFSEETGEPSIDEEALTDLLSDDRQLVSATARTLLRFRKWDTLLVKYVTERTALHRKGIPIDRTNRAVPIVHPVWKPCSAITNRWACDAPNLHNIPKPVEKRLKSGKVKVIYPGLRDIYIARPGCVLVKADYKALELRIVALLAHAVLLIQWFNAEMDVHTEHAKRLFRILEPSKTERTKIKNFVYNANYLGTPETIWRLLLVTVPDITLGEVRGMMEWYFGLHPAIPRWQQKRVAAAHRLGYAETPFTQRRRHFYGQVEDTEAVNFDVQETAAKIMNDAILRVRDGLRKDERLLIQCHDEIVVEGKDEKRLRGLLTEAMTTRLSFEGDEMPFTVDVASGPSWGECKE